MKLTALCVCGTLLAFSSLSWITADSDEGVLLRDKGFGPCTVTLRPEGPCRQVQHESTCPYLVSLPPLTVHLPQQLRELEKIVEDLQKLKDSVDELREMCADCTVSQTERECERQRESEHEKLHERTDRHEDDKNWVNERLQENGFKQQCNTEGVKTEIDGESEKRVTLEEKERNKWETERERNEGVVKENEKGETLREVSEPDGKTQTDGAKGKDKVGQTKVTTGGGNERIVGEKVADKNNREGERDRKKDAAGKGNAKGYQEDKLVNGKERESSTNAKNKETTEENGHHVWQDKTKETETQSEASDRIKMSEDHDENTNQEQEQKREERKKKMEKRIKVKQNNEELKENKSIGRTEKEETIKEEDEIRETGKEIKTEDEETESGEGDSDGEPPSSKATKRTDFVSISATPHSTISTGSSLDSVDLNKAMSSLPPPPLPSSTLHLITDVSHEITTRSTGLGGPGISEPPNPDPESGTAITMSTVSGQHITSPTTGFNSASRLTPRAGFQGHISSTTTATTTTADHQDITAFPGATDDRRWTAKKNISSNTKTGEKPVPSRGPKPGEKHKPKFKPEADKTLKNPMNDRKPGRAHHHQNLPKHGQDRTTDQNKLPIQKPKSHGKTATPDQGPAPDQIPGNTNTTQSDKYPVINREHKPDEIPTTNQTSKPEKKLVHTLKTDKPDQKQKPDKQPKGEVKTKPDQSFEVDQDSTPGKKTTPDRVKTSYNQKPKTSQNIRKKPKPTQVPKPNQNHPKPGSSFRPITNVKPKTGPKPPQTNQKLKSPKPEQTPNLNAKPAPHEVPEAESNRMSKPRPLSRYGPPTRSTVMPGVIPVQRPKPAVQPKPSPKTKTHLDPPQISWTTSDHIQTSQTNTPPTSGPEKHTAEVTHSPGDTEFNPSMSKTVTPGPKTSNRLKNGALPYLHTLPEDSTMKPNSRIMSDLRPQTTSQPPSIPMTTRPNKIIRGILPSVIPSTSPGSTQSNTIPKSDSSRQANKNHNMEEMAPAFSTTPSPASHTTSTRSPDFRSTTATTPGPELPELPAEASTPSARELRVKINQVTAFFNKTLSPNGRPPNRHPKEYSEENQGGSRPDGTDNKLPTVKPPKVTMSPRDCSDHLLRGETKSGVYLVTPDPRTRSFPVYCDMEQDGGGWTVLQRRRDGSVSFNRTWAEYQSGFGKLDGGEFWLGNNMIHLLTRDRDMMLRVDLEDFDGVKGYAQYGQFRVASERLRYKLTVGGYSGTAGDSLRFSKRYDHNNRAFTTPDRDHDRYPSGNCGAYYSSGWWFDACMSANLNGRYYVGRYKGVRDGIFWGTWYNILTEYYPTNERQSFKRVRMMIRPKGFAP